MTSEEAWIESAMTTETNAARRPRWVNDRRRAWAMVMALAAPLALAFGCSVGTGLTGQQAPPTPVHSPRPTFTPLPGALSLVPSGNPEGSVLGQLPPGVTALPPGTPGGDEGDTRLIVFATPTGEGELSPLATPAAPLSPLATPTSSPEALPATAVVGPAATPLPTPYVEVEAEAVNGRRGPDTVFDQIGEATQGEKLMILAALPDKSWWQVCCISNQPAWVIGSAVTAEGPVQIVPSVPMPPTPTTVPTPTLTFTVTSPISPLATPEPPFDIAEGPMFPMTAIMAFLTIWVKVYLNTGDPLAGYVLKVFRNGVDVSSPAQSRADVSGFWNSGPDQGSFDYNLKFEDPAWHEANWEIYLARPDGSQVSETTDFTTMGDSYRNQVVYIAYILAR